MKEEKQIQNSQQIILKVALQKSCELLCAEWYSLNRVLGFLLPQKMASSGNRVTAG